jgi:starch phosphorylase
MLLSGDRPVQFVFAGKSHPADDSGKELIRQVSSFAADPEVRHRFVFVDDYDIAVARSLLQGADVWLNNPRRPQEACGTSGMKAALNGGLNLSILDGWWDECFDGENGWAISSTEHLDLERRDELEAGSLFELLEKQVVPAFYERWQGPVPRRWVHRVRRSLVTLGPFVTAARMVRDYTERLYEPTAAQHEALLADDHAEARSLAGWKAHITTHWGGVHVDQVDVDDSVAELGTERTVTAVVALDGLAVADVQVQLLHGPAGQGGELLNPTIVPMAEAGPVDDDHRRYTGAFTCEETGRYGLSVRVVPHHGSLVTPAELGLMA